MGIRLLQYGAYNFETAQIEIDWDKIEQITDTTLGEKVSKYIGKLEETQESLDTIEDDIASIDE